VINNDRRRLKIRKFPHVQVHGPYIAARAADSQERPVHTAKTLSLPHDAHAPIAIGAILLMTFPDFHDAPYMATTCLYLTGITVPDESNRWAAIFIASIC